MSVLLWHSDLDVNIVISIAVTVHPANAFSLQTDDLIGLASRRNLKMQTRESGIFFTDTVCKGIFSPADQKAILETSDSIFIHFSLFVHVTWSYNCVGILRSNASYSPLN